MCSGEIKVSPHVETRRRRRQSLLRLRESYKVIYSEASLRAIAEMAAATASRYQVLTVRRGLQPLQRLGRTKGRRTTKVPDPVLFFSFATHMHPSQSLPPTPPLPPTHPSWLQPAEVEELSRAARPPVRAKEQKRRLSPRLRRQSLQQTATARRLSQTTNANSALGTSVLPPEEAVGVIDGALLDPSSPRQTAI